MDTFFKRCYLKLPQKSWAVALCKILYCRSPVLLLRRFVEGPPLHSPQSGSPFHRNTLAQAAGIGHFGAGSIDGPSVRSVQAQLSHHHRSSAEVHSAVWVQVSAGGRRMCPWSRAEFLPWETERSLPCRRLQSSRLLWIQLAERSPGSEGQSGWALPPIDKNFKKIPPERRTQP